MKYVNIFLVSMTFCGFTIAQSNVGVGTTTPDASAKVDITSATQGFLMPRMTEAQRNAIISPATGLMVYQTNNSDGTYYYDGTQWRNLSDNLGNHTATTTLNMDTNKIVNVPTPVAGLDAVNKDYVDAAISGGGGGSGGGSLCCMTPTHVSKESGQVGNFMSAIVYCDTLTEQGFFDWQIPFFEEAFQTRVSGLTFPDAITQNWLWTRTENPNSTTGWRVIILNDGQISSAGGTTNSYRVRCVRTN